MSRRSFFLAAFAGLIVVSAGVGLVLAVLSAQGAGGLAFGDRVAVLEIDGLISDDRVLLDDIARFRRDPSVKAMVVAINSPGGVVGPSQSVYRALRSVREDMPVVASIGRVGASGGYYVALAADSIFVLPGSITGSIGVIMEFPNARELMQKVGVEMDVVKSAEHKDIGSPFREMTEGDRALLQSVVQDVYDQFVDAVAEERELPRDDVLAVADGRVLSGRQAIERGLADAEGNLDEAIDAAAAMAGMDPSPRTVWPPRRGGSVLDAVLGEAATHARRLVGAAQGLDGPVLKFVPSF